MVGHAIIWGGWGLCTWASSFAGDLIVPDRSAVVRFEAIRTFAGVLRVILLDYHLAKDATNII